MQEKQQTGGGGGRGGLPDCSGCRQRISSSQQKQAAATGEPREPKSRQGKVAGIANQWT